MKLKLLSLLMLLPTFDLFAQIEKGNVLISVSGNYKNSTNTNGHGETKAKDFNTGGSIGYFFSNRFVAGGGLEYTYQKNTPAGPNRTDIFQSPSIMATTKGVYPYVFLGYYLPIVPKLYFNTNLKVSLGRENYTMESTIPSTVGSQLPNDVRPLYSFQSSTSETDHFEAKVTPEISYFFTKHVGAYLGFGGLSYASTKSFYSENTKWLMSFDPEYWKIGIKIVL